MQSVLSVGGGAWGERIYSFYSFLTLALDGGEWSASRPGRALSRGKDPRYPLYRSQDGPQSRSGHRGYRKNPLPLPGIEPRSPGRPVRSQTLNWLSYPGSYNINMDDGKPSMKISNEQRQDNNYIAVDCGTVWVWINESDNDTRWKN
jgi:hypothetical protein